MEQKKGMGAYGEVTPTSLFTAASSPPSHLLLETFLSDSWGVRISDSGKAFGGPQG